MCGGRMRLRAHDQTDRLPGTLDTRTRPAKEWICRECDYFEEADES